ncbi:MAG: hypothetical protein RLZZ502_145 [Pseudomonadota bacterium]|jgi:uncharacterized protein (TIGR00255 family)
MSTLGKVHSMTGYALVKQSLGNSGNSVEIELKSVNQRFFEWQCKTPEALRHWEHRCRALAQEHIHRGKLDCRINLSRAPDNAQLHLNHDLIKAVLSCAQELEHQHTIPAKLNTVELLRWPGVLSDSADLEHLPEDTLNTGVEHCFTQVLQQFQHSRANEGERIRGFMRERLAQADSARLQAQKTAQELQQKLPERLKNKLASIIDSVDPHRVEQEIVIAAQKMDVSEELDRLASHLSEYEQLLQKGGLLGKRLDFLCQELNREANTLGSKSTDISLTQQAVNLKVIIEQLREQVQNVE